MGATAIIKEQTAKLERTSHGSGYAAAHREAISRIASPHLAKYRMEAGMVWMLHGLAAWLDGYEARYGSPPGTDGVLGDEGAGKIIEGLLVLLNGELGRLDGGTLDSILRHFAKLYKFEAIEQ